MSNMVEYGCHVMIFLIKNFVFIGFANILICVSFFIVEFLSMNSCGTNQLCVRIHKGACVRYLNTLCLILMQIFVYLLLKRFNKDLQNISIESLDALQVIVSIESPHVLQETENLHRHRRLFKSG